MGYCVVNKRLIVLVHLAVHLPGEIDTNLPIGAAAVRTARRMSNSFSIAEACLDGAAICIALISVSSVGDPGAFEHRATILGPR